MAIPDGMTFVPAGQYAFDYEFRCDGDAVRYRFEFATLMEMASFFAAFRAGVLGHKE